MNNPLKYNQMPEFTSEDILWQRCGNDPELFDVRVTLSDIKTLLPLETDEVNRQVLLRRSVSLQAFIDNRIPKSAVGDKRPGKSRTPRTPTVPSGVLEEAGVGMSFAE